jgi:hypothetical protein
MDKRLRILSSFILCLIVFSCSEDVKPVPYTYSQNFTGQTSKTWKFVFMEQTLNGAVVDKFTISCASDDRYIFYNNTEHQYDVQTGTKKCNDPAEATVITDAWTFTNSSATLTMILPFFDPGTAYPFVVRDVSKSTLVTEIFIDQEATQSYRIHFSSVSED